jgi:LysM repeat protein
MLFNQEVTKPAGRYAGLACGMTALLLAAGCQLLSPKAEPAPAPRPVASKPVAVEPATSETSVEAALARGDSISTDTATAAPGPVVMNPSAPASYTVKRGDTLWGISSMYLRDPWLWPEIWHVNPAVRNPHLIYPGDVLTLAYAANGQPQVTLTAGNSLRVEPLVRSSPLDGPIATIPYQAIAAFLGRPSIVSKEELRDAPRIAALRDAHMVAGAGHDVYVKGLADKGPGRYSVVRVAEELKDPESGKVLGYMGIYTGAAQVEHTEAISRASIIESARESQAGDLLFIDDMQTSSADIVPRAPPAGVDGQIIAVVDGVRMIGQYKVVAINRGSRQGLEAGHVLAIDQRGEVVKDHSCRTNNLSWCIGKNMKLPDERAGTLLVFKTYDLMSYGLIVNASVPVRVTDRVRTP